ncbi:MAG: orotate phosphoribosyltransferase [Clostridiales bacterium]|jgi:orotate phosphoribosyltransferase|nr:orotate phosphoribosyltransferase [Clostridiales bacterium]
MEQTNKLTLDAFEATEGILHGHFLLTSGRHADTYMQCAKLFVDPRYSEPLVEALAAQLKGVAVDYVASPAVGGIVFGYALARVLGVKNVFSERVDGVMTLRRGFSIPRGANVLAVEDVVTTGGSVREVVALARAAGANVTGVASIVDRSGGAVAFDVPFYHLLSMQIQSFDAHECPLCAQGLPVVKPGSRNLK